jgi:hypothetical protein
VAIFHQGKERTPDGVPLLDGIETVSGGEGPWLKLAG